MEILDNCLFERCRIVHRSDHGRDRLKAGPLGCPPATFPGDQLKAITNGSNQHRLKYAKLAHGCRQGNQGLFVESLPWLKTIGIDLTDRQLTERRVLLPRGQLAWYQGTKTATESTTPGHR